MFLILNKKSKNIYISTAEISLVIPAKAGMTMDITQDQ